jgi:hypothetical protein
MEASMIRYLFVLALTLAVLPPVVFAQGGGAQGHLGTPEQHRACRSDVQRFCREMQNQGTMRLRIASKQTLGGSVLLAAESSKPVADKASSNE